MTTYSRLAAAAVVAVLAIGGALILIGPRFGVGGPGPTPGPTPSTPVAQSPSAAAATPIAIPAMNQTFTSPLHGYTVRHPTGWTVTAATQPWVGAGLSWGAPGLDDLRATGVRLVAASQSLAGQTAAQWIAGKSTGGPCEGASRLPSQPAVGTSTGTVTLNGCAAAGGGIASGGVVYDVLVVVGDRGYDFTVDGIVDAAYVEALLATVTFQPALAVDPSPS